jgi:hypothetical protein
MILIDIILLTIGGKKKTFPVDGAIKPGTPPFKRLPVTKILDLTRIHHAVNISHP